MGASPEALREVAGRIDALAAGPLERGVIGGFRLVAVMLDDEAVGRVLIRVYRVEAGPPRHAFGVAFGERRNRVRVYWLPPRLEALDLAQRLAELGRPVELDVPSTRLTLL